MNFLSAAQLNLTPKEYRALLLVHEEMEAGRLVHVPLFQGAPREALPSIHMFNMNWWGTKNSCGTVACIGGWAEKLGDVDFMTSDLDREHLSSLFYPEFDDKSFSYDAVTVEMAKLALENYLTNGTPNWNAVITASRD
jgi:hypothetical protein